MPHRHVAVETIGHDWRDVLAIGFLGSNRWRRRTMTLFRALDGLVRQCGHLFRLSFTLG